MVVVGPSDQGRASFSEGVRVSPFMAFAETKVS